MASTVRIKQMQMKTDAYTKCRGAGHIACNGSLVPKPSQATAALVENAASLDIMLKFSKAT